MSAGPVSRRVVAKRRRPDRLTDAVLGMLEDTADVRKAKAHLAHFATHCTVNEQTGERVFPTVDDILTRTRGGDVVARRALAGVVELLLDADVPLGDDGLPVLSGLYLGREFDSPPA